jgi:hypothetical protein
VAQPHSPAAIRAYQTPIRATSPSAVLSIKRIKRGINPFSNKINFMKISKTIKNEDKMNSFQLTEQIDKFLGAIQREEDFLKNIHLFPSLYEDFLHSSVSFIRSSDDLGKANNSLDLRYDTSRTRIKRLNIREMFKSIDKLEYAVANYASKEIQELGQKFLTSLLEFSKTYDIYLNTPSSKELELLDLLEAGRRLSWVMDMTISALADLKKSVSHLASHTDIKGYKRFSLYSETNGDFSRFSERLYCINIIYLEFCSLLNISPTEYPMSILKVESGSSWTDVLAYPQIVSLFTSLIERTVDYFYRTFTREGKIVTLPREVDAVERILELRKDLKEAGIDTSKIDDQLAKSTVVIAERLNKLLVGEPKIVLNGKVKSIESSVETKYLEASKQFLLPVGVQEPPKDDSPEESAQ